MILHLLACQLQSEKNNTPDSGASESGDTAQVLVSRFEVQEQTPSVVHSDYTVSTWTLNPESSPSYASLFENEEPTFYVLHPNNMPSSAPIMWWFHGSAFGLDIDDTPRGCQSDIIVPTAKRVVSSENVPAALLSHNGWIVVAPRNDWCDMWRGEGLEDISDPEHHYGGQHMREVLQFVRDGGLGVQPEQEALWGTSMGGVAAMRAASLYPPFSSMIIDSSPSSALLFYEIEHGINDQAALEHVFGGPPYNSDGSQSSFYESYRSGTAEWLLEEGALNLPLFAHFNSLDLVTPVNHPHALREALVNFGTAGSGVHDHHHPSPGQDAHVQTLGGPNLDQGYTASAMMHFILGKSVRWIEAESDCPSCTAGTIVTASEQPELKSLSGSAGRKLDLSEVGIFWAQPIAPEISHIQPMLSRVNSNQNLIIQFYQDATPLSSAEMSPDQFIESGLESVRNSLQQSYISVPAQANRYTIELGENSSAILDGVLIYSDRP